MCAFSQHLSYMRPLPQGNSGAIKKERGNEILQRGWSWLIRSFS